MASATPTRPSCLVSRPNIARRNHAGGPSSRWSYFSDPDDPERLDTGILQSNRDHLASGLAHITTWVDKTVAHLDHMPTPRVPLYMEIPEALNLLADVTGHYEDLLPQSVTSDWNVIIQGDWQEPFRSSLF